MTRQAFIARLRDGLRGLPPQTIADIVADYETHFADGEAAGRSEEEVARALGDPGRLARELRAEIGLKRWEEERSPSGAASAIFAVLGLGALDLLILLPLLMGVGGTLFGLVAVLAIARAQPIAPALQLLVVVLPGVGGVVLRDHLLQRAARARLQRISAELPTILEFLTLSLSAGEGILDALRRVSRISHGALAGELADVVAGVNTGLPLGESLASLADGIRLPALSRCVDQIIGALERGTPLAEVLRAQAQDGRDDAKRELLEIAGKKEVAMLVPLVFLILPTTIAFAIFPGIFVLQMGF